MLTSNEAIEEGGVRMAVNVKCRNIDCIWCEHGYCQADDIQINYDFECETREDYEEEEDYNE